MPFNVLMVAPHGVRVGRHVADPIGRLIAELDAGLTALGHRSVLLADRGSASAREFIALPEGRGPFLRAAIEEIRDATRIDVIHVHHPALVGELPHLAVPVLVTLHEDPRDLDASAFAWHAGVYPHALSAWQRERCPPRTPLLCDIAPGLTPHRTPALIRARSSKIVALGSRVEHLEAHHRAERAGFAPVWIEEPCGWRRFISGSTALWIADARARAFWACALDAMCAGTPLLVPRDGALAELVDEGLTGFTYASGEEFEAALQGCGGLPRRLCERAARERHSARGMVERFLAAYSALAGRGAWVHVANAAPPS